MKTIQITGDKEKIEKLLRNIATRIKRDNFEIKEIEPKQKKDKSNGNIRTK